MLCRSVVDAGKINNVGALKVSDSTRRPIFVSLAAEFEKYNFISKTVYLNVENWVQTTFTFFPFSSLHFLSKRQLS
jgi:hypothetical protein